MKKGLYLVLAAAAALLAVWALREPTTPAGDPAQAALEERQAKRALTKRARQAYFDRMLRDPATGTIPPAIRRRELAYARTLPRRSDMPAKDGLMPLFNWREAGPSGVGGRTRALVLAAGNTGTLLAAGATGGIWKSTDSGVSWALQSGPDDALNITALAQDPRPNNRNRWYAGAGEFRGSGSDNGSRAFVYGPGIYVSQDNGETWALSAVDTDEVATRFDSQYDYVHRIVVSPTTGTVFLAANGFGIWRSTDQGASFTAQLGPFGLLPIWSEIAVASDGSLLAVLSSGFVDEPTETPGVYRSTNDGLTWTNVTPAGFVAEHERSVVAIAPSNPNIAYVLTYTGESTDDGGSFEDEEIHLYRMNLADGTSEDRSANIPDFGDPVGVMTSQSNYNLAIAVKPDDEDFVLIGGINLFRSRDGFATPPTTAMENWVGGYDITNNIAQYPNQHADQHAIVFDPATPSRVWVGHDGGISVTEDITVSGQRVAWTRRNDGYHVTQFYHVSLAPASDDDRLLGGTQDNGSPFFRYDAVLDEATASRDMTSGDGGHAYLGDSYAIASSQNGRLLFYGYNPSGDFIFRGTFTPADASDQLFINPFAVDAIDETVVYYPAGATLWRLGEGAAQGNDWTLLSALTVDVGYAITAMAAGARDAGEGSPISVLYYAASGEDDPDRVPRLFRLDNARTATSGAAPLTLSGVPSGAYIHDIAVNPADGNELLVVISNYNVESLYHSTDAGATFTTVEGNLNGDEETPGPSLRSASILPVGGGAVYLVGTSTGVYATETLNGPATVWIQEAEDALGNAIVQSIASRPSDGRVALGTHGRGLFVGLPLMPVANEADDALPALFALHQNYPNPFNPTTAIGFTLQAPGVVSLNVYDAAGRRVRTLLRGENRPAGTHQVTFDASSLASGAYIYTLEARPTTETTGRPSVLSKTMILSR